MPGFTKSYTSADKLTVQFTDTSKNAAKWLWYFGDGDTSTAQNPQHTFPNPGAGNNKTYFVKLIVTSPEDRRRDSTEIPTTIGIAAIPPKDAALTFEDEGYGFFNFHDGNTVRFTGEAIDASSCTFHWAFGDGTFADGQTVAHTYYTSGDFPVSLTIISASGGVARRSALIHQDVYSSMTVTSPSLTINAAPKPVARLTWGTGYASEAAYDNVNSRWVWTTTTIPTIDLPFNIAAGDAGGGPFPTLILQRSVTMKDLYYEALSNGQANTLLNGGTVNVEIDGTSTPETGSQIAILKFTIKLNKVT